MKEQLAFSQISNRIKLIDKVIIIVYRSNQSNYFNKKSEVLASLYYVATSFVLNINIKKRIKTNKL